MLNCQEAIENRRSIRKFDSKPVATEKLEQIIEAARLAPSGTNRQPWRFILLSTQADKDKIVGTVVQPFVCEAPAVFVCCLDRKAYVRKVVEKRMSELVQANVISEEAAQYIYQRKMPEKEEEIVVPDSGYLDLGIAIQNMALMATALGLGSCWVRLFNQKELHRALDLPENLIPVVLLPVGYPAQDPPPRPRLKREEIVFKV
jgi:nitroreductase